MKNLISISCIVLLALTSCMEEKEVIGNKPPKILKPRKEYPSRLMYQR